MQTAARPLLRRGLIAAALGAAALAALAIATTSSSTPERGGALQHAANKRTRAPARPTEARGRPVTTARADRRVGDGGLGISPRPAAPAWSRAVESPTDVRSALDRLPQSVAFEPADTAGIRDRLRQMTR
jgi:hypothetical protein